MPSEKAFRINYTVDSLEGSIYKTVKAATHNQAEQRLKQFHAPGVVKIFKTIMLSDGVSNGETISTTDD